MPDNGIFSRQSSRCRYKTFIYLYLHMVSKNSHTLAITNIAFQWQFNNVNLILEKGSALVSRVTLLSRPRYSLQFFLMEKCQNVKSKLFLHCPVAYCWNKTGTNLKDWQLKTPFGPVPNNTCSACLGGGELSFRVWRATLLSVTYEETYLLFRICIQCISHPSYCTVPFSGRYHFAGLHGEHYERVPYRNHQTGSEIARHVTR